MGIVDQIPSGIGVQVQDPSKRLTSKDSIDILNLIRDRTTILAKITALSDVDRGDEFIADLYADGRVTLTAPEDMYKTHSGVYIYNPYIYNTYAIGDLCYVTLQPNFTGVIFAVAGNLPKGQYQYQFFGNVSQNQTGFMFIPANSMESGI